MAEHRDTVAAYGLPTALPEGAEAAALIKLMVHDKKAVDERLTFVLDGPDGVELVPDVPRPVVDAALEATR